MVDKSKVISVPIGTVNYQLTVTSEPFRLPGKKAFVIRCKCSCGNETVVSKSAFIHGWIKSCGCRIADSSRARMTRHGMSGTRIYRIWQGMIRRTTVPKCPQFKRYGSLGICKGWLRFEGFLTWAASHGYSDGLSIDRIDNDKGYYPSNCRWATPKQQARNTSWNVHVKVDGREFTSLTEASEAYGLARATVEGRLRRGWKTEEALHTPADERFRKGERYAYTMHVTETVESKCVIESDRKLTFEQLRRRAEKRRANGKLTCTGVSDVEIWCEAVSKDGQPDDNEIL